MMHSTNSLYDALRDNLAQINNQIAATVEDLEKQIAVLPYPDGVSVYQMKNRDGSFVLAPLLAAKAQVLGGMAALKAADMQPRHRK